MNFKKKSSSKTIYKTPSTSTTKSNSSKFTRLSRCASSSKDLPLSPIPKLKRNIFTTNKNTISVNTTSYPSASSYPPTITPKGSDTSEISSQSSTRTTLTTILLSLMMPQPMEPGKISCNSFRKKVTSQLKNITSSLMTDKWKLCLIWGELPCNSANLKNYSWSLMAMMSLSAEMSSNSIVPYFKLKMHGLSTLISCMVRIMLAFQDLILTTS